MEACVLRHCFPVSLCRVFAAPAAGAFGLGQGLMLNSKDEATGERDRVADKIDLGALTPLTGEVMLPFITCDHGGEGGIEVAVDHIEMPGCRWLLDTNGLTVEAVSPSGGEELTEGTLIDNAGGLLITLGAVSGPRTRRCPR